LLPALTGAGLAFHFVTLDLRGVNELTCPGYARPVCLVLRKTRWYRLLFGVPNPVWALAFFVFAIWAMTTALHSPLTTTAVRIVAGLGMAYALALQTILAFYLRVVCWVCLLFTLLALMTGLCILQ